MEYEDLLSEDEERHLVNTSVTEPTRALKERRRTSSERRKWREDARNSSKGSRSSNSKESANNKSSNNSKQSNLSSVAPNSSEADSAHMEQQAADVVRKSLENMSFVFDEAEETARTTEIAFSHDSANKND